MTDKQCGPKWEEPDELQRRRTATVAKGMQAAAELAALRRLYEVASAHVDLLRSPSTRRWEETESTVLLEHAVRHVAEVSK